MTAMVNIHRIVTISAISIAKLHATDVTSHQPTSFDATHINGGSYHTIALTCRPCPCTSMIASALAASDRNTVSPPMAAALVEEALPCLARAATPACKNQPNSFCHSGKRHSGASIGSRRVQRCYKVSVSSLRQL